VPVFCGSDHLGGGPVVAQLDRALRDWKNVCVRTATEAERCAGQVPLTQFGRMCEKLGNPA
jgi:hypothetical protein